MATDWRHLEQRLRDADRAHAVAKATLESAEAELKAHAVALRKLGAQGSTVSAILEDAKRLAGELEAEAESQEKAAEAELAAAEKLMASGGGE